MSQKLAWGIIGTGGIAKVFARALAASSTGELLAVGSRAQATADAFGEEFAVPRRYGSYEALLADPDVQAVYLCTPHPMHAEWAIKAARAGKHILCEKPLTINYYEAMAVVEAAACHDVFLMEAFMFRCLPQTKKLVELLRAKTIGDVRVIQATFSFHATFNPEGRHLKNALGGGGIMDLGCYCASMARLIAGVDQGKDFVEPLEVKAVGHIGEITNVDEWSIAILRFPGDIIAELSVGLLVNQESVLRIFGSEGQLTLTAPWFASYGPGETTIRVQRNGEEPYEVGVRNDESIYTIEADTVAAGITKRQADPPAMTWDDTLGNMRTLDRWRREIGLVYESERPDAWTLPIDKLPLAVRADAQIPADHIPGLDKPVSRLLMGTMEPTNIVYASVMFDDFFARGGNAFDTAYIYGAGASERALGQWVANRGLREQIVIVDKGGHTPFCNPVDLSRQLLESLERLQTDYIDVYMTHRDNLDLPVDEFVDVFNEHVHAGRIRLYGVSNWSIARVEAANAYATAKGLHGISVLSNNFSLARMVNPLWSGSLSVSDPASRAWLTRTQLPLLPWSSQARGFFVHGDPNYLSNTELVNSWYSEDNFRRLARVKEAATQRGVTPLNIALAYVLNQPFPTFPLVGPYALAETRTLLPALSITFTPDEMRWLNLED